MQNVLVTGGAGFIGSNFIHFLLRGEPDIHIVNLDALTYAGSLDNLRALPNAHRHTFIQGDICDAALLRQLFNEHNIDTVVHFAAETHVDRSITDPSIFIHTNINGTFTLLEAARQHWLNTPLAQTARFHHISTDEVFGSLGPNDPPFSETTPYAPNSPYSASKAASDHLVRAYFHTYHLPVTISNCSNNYGPRQFLEKLIPLMIHNACNDLPLPVYGDGRQIRDWLYVEDHCAAIFQILLRGRLGETYTIGGNNQPPNIEVIQTICAILDELQPEKSPHSRLIQSVRDRPGHDRRYDVSIDKIKTELDWQPSQSLHSGLRKTVDWYLSNPDWVEKIRARPDYQHWMQTNYTNRGASQA